MKNICMGGVGRVYDEYNISIGKFLVDSTCDMSAAQYFFLYPHGNDNCWTSANTIEECNPATDILECFTNRIKIVIDIIKGIDVDWALGIGHLNKGVKVGEITFWYSKVQKEFIDWMKWRYKTRCRRMKIIVDKMPEYPYECRNCRLEEDTEFHNWVCQVGEEKHICKDTSLCPYFVSINDVLRKEG